MAFTDCRGLVHVVQGNATTAQVNAGKRLVEPRQGKKIQVVGGHMTARGGAAATCDSVDLKDMAASPVVAVALAQASLTEDTQLDFDAAAGVTKTTFRKPLTVNKGLQIKVSGSDLATATSVDYYVEYCFVL